ncbi:MAG: hypothetical protein DCC58_17970, partial [Chloroflexi bacterium]
MHPAANVGMRSDVAALLGYTPAEWQSDPGLWLTRIHPDDRARVQAERDRADRAGEPFDSEYRMLARDGREVWVRDMALLLHDQSGGPLHWQQLKFDITAYKQAEQQALAVQRQCQRLLDQTPCIIYRARLDAVSTTEYISSRVETMLGYPAEKFVQDPYFWLSLVHPDDREAVRQDLAA